MTFKRFTLDEIAKLRLMAECGHGAVAIGRALDRPPAAVRTKCSSFGIRLKPAVKPRHDQARLKMQDHLWVEFRKEAAARGMAAARLARLILEAVTRDRIYDA